MFILPAVKVRGVQMGIAPPPQYQIIFSSIYAKRWMVWHKKEQYDDSCL